jgi:hypothetical protein
MFLQREPRVIGTDRNSHGERLYYVRRRATFVVRRASFRFVVRRSSFAEPSTTNDAPRTSTTNIEPRTSNDSDSL